jgi:hypothetical protein
MIGEKFWSSGCAERFYYEGRPRSDAGSELTLSHVITTSIRNEECENSTFYVTWEINYSQRPVKLNSTPIRFKTPEREYLML